MDVGELRELWSYAVDTSKPSLERFKKLAKAIVKSWRSGDPETVARIRQQHPRLRKLSESELRNTRFTLADAQFIIARACGFESWPKLKRSIEAPASAFELAVEAVVSGDLATLERLLQENPELIRERSARAHRSTLLHYVGANGVEAYRQKTPPNAVAVTEMLLRGGADVDATADMYGGGSTTLGLVASSTHPARAGLQGALIETLLDAEAAIDGLPGGWEPIMAAIVHAHSDAVETLVRRGARLNVASAAAAGRLDVVELLVNEGRAADAVRGLPAEWKARLELAYIWACLFGRWPVAEFLLDRGVDPGAQDGQGETGMHWAAHYGHVDLVRHLIERKVPLEIKNNYGGTVLGQTTWAVMNDPRDTHPPIVRMLIEAGAHVDQADYPTGNESIDELLRKHGSSA